MAGSTDQDSRRKTLPLQTHEAPQGGQGRRKRESPASSAPAAGARAGRDQQRLSDPASQLRREVDEAGRKYMEVLRKSDILAAKKTPKERASQLTGIHKAYVSMMVLSCLQPLEEGINAKSALSVVGMGSAMWMLSPNFRDQVGDFGEQMKETIVKKIDERRQGQIENTINSAHAKTEDGTPLSRRWQSKLEHAEQAARGGRDAYTAQSAGMTEVALTENAYAAMRVEGADVDAIRDAHTSMIEDLYAQAHEDGVEASEVATAARVVVGLRLTEEPELASVFGELSHGQFARSDPREVRISGTGETAHVWTGEFESRLGQKIEAGSFGLRDPMDADGHQAAIADTMTADMIALTRQYGVDGLNMGVVSYAAAWGLKDRPDYGGMLTMDNRLGERLRTSRVMMNTMDADSISPSAQQQIYSNAYVDALENVRGIYPEVEQEWAAKFGEDWRENMRDFVSNPQSYMDRQSDGQPAPAGYEAPQAWEAGPARKYRNARINQNYIETAKTGVLGLGSDSSDYRDQDFDMGG